MLLNGFTDADGWLHWCRLDQPDIVVRPARPLELFQKKHLYSIITAGGGKDPSIEIGLSKLETDTVPVLQQIADSARANQVPELSDYQKSIWYQFFSMQWRRTPETQQISASDEDIAAMFDDSVQNLRKVFPERTAEIDALDTPAGRERTIRNVRAQSLTRFSESVIGVLQRRGITILRIRKPNKSFIVGSRPVVKLTVAGQSDLTNPIVEMWLPIASDIAVGVGNGTGATSLLFLDDERPIRQLNLAIAQQSRIIAARSPQLVTSIASPT